jgi:hypothetical protein
MTGAENISETLRNVRQAYRYLHEFQLRLRDTIERFRQEFHGYTYCFSGPIYTDVPTFRTNPHDDKWTVDLFPAHTYSIRYEKQTMGEKSTLLEVMFHCDTNFEADSDQFPAEKEGGSETSLEVYFWITNEAIEENIKWQSLWKNTEDYPDFGEVKTFKESAVSAIGIALNFDNLLDEESIVIEAERVKREIEKHFDYTFQTTRML